MLISYERFTRQVKACYPEVYREITLRLESKTIPTRSQADYLLSRASHYGDELKLVFVASFVLSFDPQSFKFDIDMITGMRNTIASELSIRPDYVSKILRIAKVRYNCIHSFKNRIDAIVCDLKNMELVAVK
jgi:hypothetical protein